MAARHWVLPGLVALLFLGKKAVDHWPTAADVAHVPMTRMAPTVPDSAVPAGIPASRVAEFARSVTVVTERAPVALPAESTAMTAEVIQLQQLAQGSDLELSPRQWLALAAVTRDIQAIRQAYEATIATTSPLGQGRYRIEVPVYAAAGDALREKFQAALRAELGDANADEILASMGRRLEGYFGGFGVSVQTLEIAAAVSTDPECTVTRTVRFWNSIDGAEQLATRRETHFPNLEDPNGDMWRPFLDLTAQAGG